MAVHRKSKMVLQDLLFVTGSGSPLNGNKRSETGSGDDDWYCTRKGSGCLQMKRSREEEETTDHILGTCCIYRLVSGKKGKYQRFY